MGFLFKFMHMYAKFSRRLANRKAMQIHDGMPQKRRRKSALYVSNKWSRNDHDKVKGKWVVVDRFFVARPFMKRSPIVIELKTIWMFCEQSWEWRAHACALDEWSYCSCGSIRMEEKNEEMYALSSRKPLFGRFNCPHQLANRTN